MKRYAVLAIAVLLLGSACASDAARMAQRNRQSQRIHAALLAAGDADSLAAAALMVFPTDKQPANRLALIERASALAPTRLDLAWLHIQICRREDACDSGPLEERLRALDPKNGAGWLYAVYRAQADGAPEELRKNLAAMASAEGFDVYWTAIVSHTARAAIKAGEKSNEAALNAIGSASALVIPAYHRLSDICGDQSLEQPTLIAQCRGMAASMRRGDTYITEMIGVAMEQRLWADDSLEYQTAVQDRRRGSDEMTRCGKFGGRDLLSASLMEKHLRLLASLRTEQDVCRAQIAADKPS